MRIISFILLGWFAISMAAFIFENAFFYWQMRRLGIPINFLFSGLPRYLSEVYRSWGEAKGREVDFRLKIRKVLAVNALLSWIGFAVAFILIQVSRTNP
jgi:hypothetical protein